MFNSVGNRNHIESSEDESSDASPINKRNNVRKGKEPEPDEEEGITIEDVEPAGATHKRLRAGGPRPKAKAKRPEKRRKAAPVAEEEDDEDIEEEQEESASDNEGASESENEIGAFSEFERQFLKETENGFEPKESWLAIEKTEAKTRVVTKLHIPKLDTLGWFKAMIEFLTKYNSSRYKTFKSLGQALVRADNGAPLVMFLKENMVVFQGLCPQPKCPGPDKKKKTADDAPSNDEPRTPAPASSSSSSNAPPPSPSPSLESNDYPLTVSRIPDPELGDAQEADPVSDDARRKAVEEARRMAEENQRPDSASNSIVYRSPRPNEDPREYVTNMGNALKQSYVQEMQKRLKQVEELNSADAEKVEEAKKLAEQRIQKLDSPRRTVVEPPSPARPLAQESPVRTSPSPSMSAPSSPATPSPEIVKKTKAKRGPMTQDSASRLKSQYMDCLKKLDLQHTDPAIVKKLKSCFEAALMRAESS